MEKPDVEDAPSNLAVIGRYVLHPAVFDVLEHTEPGRGGEIQLTDALQELAAGDGEGYGVYGVVFRGRRYDTGDKLSYLKACVQLACDSDDLGPGLRDWLPGFAASLSSQPDQVTPVGGSFNWPVTLESGDIVLRPIRYRDRKEWTDAPLAQQRVAGPLGSIQPRSRRRPARLPPDGALPQGPGRPGHGPAASSSPRGRRVSRSPSSSAS